MNGKMEMNTKFWLENMEDNYVRIAEKGKRIILKCILKNRMWMCELTVTVSEQDPVNGCCKPVNTLRTGLLNCLNARSRGLTFRHRASSV